jgi:hypothetical protein
VPSFELLVDDLSTTRDEALHSRTMTALGRLALFCLKRARHSSDLLVELERWTDVMTEVLRAPNGVAALSHVLSYILQVTQVSLASLRTFVARMGPAAEEAYMTGAQQLREQGRAEGRAETVTRLLRVKFGEVPADLVARLRPASVDELDRWIARILVAASIEELFAEDE